MTPPAWSQALGLLLFVLLVLALRAAHRGWLRYRFYRAVARPFPGRTRDLVRVVERCEAVDEWPPGRDPHVLYADLHDAEECPRREVVGEGRRRYATEPGR